ncbi:uncharacterized protein LOC126738688 [Anthonomus grandis grandis]|uniref:uncharacterized protein LOC126738688 n=1 Tax=Anthonomus grandis grandis TaxID=2921223 RepID=UPI002164F299|nr:uncharacterized protein LOC126738688 [Anthonomus grandis grandis]
MSISPEKLNKVRRRLNFDSPSTSNDSPAPNVPEKKEPEFNPDPPLATLDALSQKYNFDFRNEVPLEGDWEWEVVAPPQRILDHKEVVKNLKVEDEFRDDRKV